LVGTVFDENVFTACPQQFSDSDGLFTNDNLLH